MPVPEPKDDEVCIKVHAAGVNFVDTYQRSGLYPLPLPATLGKEGAGIVTKVGAAVADVKVGDRVAFAQLQGAYAEYICGKASQVVIVPAQVLILVHDHLPMKLYQPHDISTSTMVTRLHRVASSRSTSPTPPRACCRP